MKKKVNVFGKSIPVLAIFVLGIALVSAALVPYLSNVITGNVIANSPMEQKITLTEGAWEGNNTLNFDAMYGGGVITFFTKTENLATDQITGEVMNLVISEPIGTIEVECDDFTLSATTTSTYKNSGDVPIAVNSSCTNMGSGLIWECGPYTPYCVKTTDKDNELRIHYGPDDVIIWAGEQVDVTEVTVTFAVNAFGDYEFTSEVLAPSTK